MARPTGPHNPPRSIYPASDSPRHPREELSRYVSCFATAHRRSRSTARNRSLGNTLRQNLLAARMERMRRRNRRQDEGRRKRRISASNSGARGLRLGIGAGGSFRRSGKGRCEVGTKLYQGESNRRAEIPGSVRPRAAPPLHDTGDDLGPWQPAQQRNVHHILKSSNRVNGTGITFCERSSRGIRE